MSEVSSLSLFISYFRCLELLFRALPEDKEQGDLIKKKILFLSFLFYKRGSHIEQLALSLLF